MQDIVSFRRIYLALLLSYNLVPMAVAQELPPIIHATPETAQMPPDILISPPNCDETKDSILLLPPSYEQHFSQHPATFILALHPYQQHFPLTPEIINQRLEKPAVYIPYKEGEYIPSVRFLGAEALEPDRTIMRLYFDGGLGDMIMDIVPHMQEDHTQPFPTGTLHVFSVWEDINETQERRVMTIPNEDPLVLAHLIGSLSSTTESQLDWVHGFKMKDAGIYHINLNAGAEHLPDYTEHFATVRHTHDTVELYHEGIAVLQRPAHAFETEFLKRIEERVYTEPTHLDEAYLQVRKTHEETFQREALSSFVSGLPEERRTIVIDRLLTTYLTPREEYPQLPLRITQVIPTHNIQEYALPKTRAELHVAIDVPEVSAFINSTSIVFHQDGRVTTNNGDIVDSIHPMLRHNMNRMLDSEYSGIMTWHTAYAEKTKNGNDIFIYQQTDSGITAHHLREEKGTYVILGSDGTSRPVADTKSEAALVFAAKSTMGRAGLTPQEVQEELAKGEREWIRAKIRIAAEKLSTAIHPGLKDKDLKTDIDQLVTRLETTCDELIPEVQQQKYILDAATGGFVYNTEVLENGDVAVYASWIDYLVPDGRLVKKVPQRFASITLHSGVAPVEFGGLSSDRPDKAILIKILSQPDGKLGQLGYIQTINTWIDERVAKNTPGVYVQFCEDPAQPLTGKRLSDFLVSTVTVIYAPADKKQFTLPLHREYLNRFTHRFRTKSTTPSVEKVSYELEKPATLRELPQTVNWERSDAKPITPVELYHLTHLATKAYGQGTIETTRLYARDLILQSLLEEEILARKGDAEIAELLEAPDDMTAMLIILAIDERSDALRALRTGEYLDWREKIDVGKFLVQTKYDLGHVQEGYDANDVVLRITKKKTGTEISFGLHEFNQHTVREELHPDDGIIKEYTVTVSKNQLTIGGLSSAYGTVLEPNGVTKMYINRQLRLDGPLFFSGAVTELQHMFFREVKQIASAQWMFMHRYPSFPGQYVTAGILAEQFKLPIRNRRKRSWDDSMLQQTIEDIVQNQFMLFRNFAQIPQKSPSLSPNPEVLAS